MAIGDQIKGPSSTRDQIEGPSSTRDKIKGPSSTRDKITIEQWQYLHNKYNWIVQINKSTEKIHTNILKDS